MQKKKRKGEGEEGRNKQGEEAQQKFDYYDKVCCDFMHRYRYILLQKICTV